MKAKPVRKRSKGKEKIQRNRGSDRAGNYKYREIREV